MPNISVDPLGLEVYWKDIETLTLFVSRESIGSDFVWKPVGKYTVSECKKNFGGCQYGVPTVEVLSKRDYYIITWEIKIRQEEWIKREGVVFIQNGLNAISIGASAVALVDALVPEPFLTKAKAVILGVVSVGSGIGSWAISGYAEYGIGNMRDLSKGLERDKISETTYLGLVSWETKEGKTNPSIDDTKWCIKDFLKSRFPPIIIDLYHDDGVKK